jgi:hypothetical protein
MHSFPVTVLDDFFDDPDKIRKWALQQNYTKDENGQWPGMRSEPLFQLDNSFFHSFTKKFFSLFYDLNVEEINWIIDARFQLVDRNYESGWIHTDEKFSQITGIIYLNPDAELNSGTTIYRERKDLIQSNHNYTDLKIESFSNTSNIESVKQYKNLHNSQYEETIKISNVYNRLICFDSHLHHAAQDFFGNNEQSRLTLVFFVNNLLVNNTPISRVRRTTR